MERVRTEARGPQLAWDEVIARAPSDVLKRMKTSREAEAETQVNLRSPLAPAPSEDYTVLDHPGRRVPPPNAASRSDTEARSDAPSFLDITQRPPPSVKQAPAVFTSTPRSLSDTLPPFEAPTLQPARPVVAKPVVAPPTKPVSAPPPTRVDAPRDATLKGVVMSEAEAHARAAKALENPPVKLRTSPSLVDDLELPPSRPSEQSASDLVQPTMYGVLAPEPPSQSMGGATRVAVKDALAGGSPSRGQVPAYGAAAARARDELEIEIDAPLPWEVSDPEATPQLDFDRAPLETTSDQAPVRAGSGLGIGELSLPGEPVLGTGLSRVLEPPAAVDGEVRVQVAGLGRRWMALLLDTLLVAGVVAGLAALGLFGARLEPVDLVDVDRFTGLLRDGELTLPLVVFVALLFLGSLVFRLSVGRTPGELVARVRLVRARDAERPGLLRIVLRAVLGLVSFALAGAGYFFTILDRRSRTLHDVLSGVLLIRGEPRRPAPPVP